jgi:hypothetical protein
MASGEYDSPDAVVTAGLFLLKSRHGQIAELRQIADAALAEGVDLSDEEVDRALADRVQEMRTNGL